MSDVQSALEGMYSHNARIGAEQRPPRPHNMSSQEEAQFFKAQVGMFRTIWRKQPPPELTPASLNPYNEEDSEDSEDSDDYQDEESTKSRSAGVFYEVSDEVVASALGQANQPQADMLKMNPRHTEFVLQFAASKPMIRQSLVSGASASDALTKLYSLFVATGNDDIQAGEVIVSELQNCCWWCKKSEAKDGTKLRQCSQCRVQRVCGTACQREDWVEHKVECQFRGDVNSAARKDIRRRGSCVDVIEYWEDNARTATRVTIFENDTVEDVVRRHVALLPEVVTGVGRRIISLRR